MSRFGDCDDYEGYFPNQGAFWQANVRRALKGKRGQKALRELREALLALPERRLISGALCTVGGVEARTPERDHYNWYKNELKDKIEEEGQGVCAIGAFLWHKRVKGGTDPQTAFEELPTLLDIDGGDYETARAGSEAGLAFTLAWSLAYRNDETYEGMTPEERYEEFMKWIDSELGVPDGAPA